MKNEAVSLCRGKYIIELDHDDEILPDCLSPTPSNFLFRLLRRDILTNGIANCLISAGV